ncbi:hypothetical protein BDR26DRAFT_874904 [Obelidium mucronatum]|nr:hypothetical protein BDR26DRAFT_874904 [Obelidium mucronatum]
MEWRRSPRVIIVSCACRSQAVQPLEQQRQRKLRRIVFSRRKGLLLAPHECSRSKAAACASRQLPVLRDQHHKATLAQQPRPQHIHHLNLVSGSNVDIAALRTDGQVQKRIHSAQCQLLFSLLHHRCTVVLQLASLIPRQYTYTSHGQAVDIVVLLVRVVAGSCVWTLWRNSGLALSQPAALNSAGSIRPPPTATNLLTASRCVPDGSSARKHAVALAVNSLIV